MDRRRGRWQSAALERETVVSVAKERAAGRETFTAAPPLVRISAGVIVKSEGERDGRDCYAVMVLAGTRLRPTGRLVSGAVSNRELGDLYGYGARVSVCETGGEPPLILEGGGGGEITVNVTFEGLAPHAHIDQTTGSAGPGCYSMGVDS